MRARNFAEANRSHAVSVAFSTSKSMTGQNPGDRTSFPSANRSGSAKSRSFGLRNPLNSLQIPIHRGQHSGDCGQFLMNV
jgi:hypothetical protein